MDTLRAGDSLPVDGQLSVGGGQYAVVMQGDGNLVLVDAGAPVWATGTGGSGAVRAELQRDGNLVLTTASGRPVWSSNTSGYPDATLVLQRDRNLVLLTPDGRAVWASGTSNGRELPPDPAPVTVDNRVIPA